MKKAYKVVKREKKQKRSFKIKFGISGDLASEKKELITQRVLGSIVQWMEARIREEKPILIIDGISCRDSIGGFGKSGMIYLQVEPIVKIQGANSHGLADDDFIEMLNDLAWYFGIKFNQPIVYVSYCDEGWALLEE